MNAIALIIAIAVIIIVVAVVFGGIKIIRPEERGIYMRGGRFIKVLDPGMNFVIPLISTVAKVDMQTQVLDIPKCEVSTKDGSTVSIDTIVRIKVTDAKKAYFEVADYHKATVAFTQRALASVVEDMTLEELVSNKEGLHSYVKYNLDRDTNELGLDIESVEIKNIEISPEDNVQITIKKN